MFGPDPKGDVEAELSFHLEMRVRELIERGESAARARDLALERFGDYESSRRQCVEISERRGRSMARQEYFRQLVRDVRYALRVLRSSPGFTIVAVLTLALGIGANSAIFSVVQAVVLRPLPYPDADRLHRVRMLYPDGTAYTALSAPDFMSVRAETRVFDRVEAYVDRVVTLLDAGEPREIRETSVSDGLFELLGLRLTLGRGFLADEHGPNRERAAVLDHGFWQRMFGGNPDLLGRPVRIAGVPHTIVGVLAPGDRLPDETDIYVPLQYGETFSATTARGRRSEFLAVLARAKPEPSGEQIESDLRRVGSVLQTAFPETNARLTFNSLPLHQLIVGDVRKPLFVLMAAVAFVLLVACANVANLLLARSSARQAEMTVRAALGAGRGRLIRQLFAEAVVLGLAGGLTGLAIAYWMTRALVAAQPADIPRLNGVGVNGAVVAFTLGVALATSLIFGVAPALQATGRGLLRTLQAGGRGNIGGAGQRVRSALVVAEMALAVVLLTGAGLFIRSFVELTRVQPGFRPEQAMTFRLTLQGDQYREPEQRHGRVTLFEERIRTMPGVTAIGGTTTLPLTSLGAIWNFSVIGAAPPPPDVNQEIAVSSITPDYFQAAGTAMRQGREFTPRDTAEAPPVAIINEAGARRWFPTDDPIGRRVEVGNGRPEIVGVVADVLQDPGVRPGPLLFLPYAQVTRGTIRFVVRTAGDPLSLAPAIRAEIRSIDPQLAITDFTPLEQLAVRAVARPRFYTSLLALFAAVALTLAATGIFGVMSFAVAQRTREISIRMALGARAGDVLRMIVGRALALVGIGTLLGIFAAQILGRFIEKQLFGVTLFDPATLVAVVVLLSATATLASFLPARRAAALDPADALRET